MIELATLHDALVGEIRDLYGAEKQLLRALTRTAPSVRTAGVRDVVAQLLTDTGNQLWRLEEVFTLLDEDLSSRHCLQMARILDTRMEPPRFERSSPAADAAVASQVQRAAHFLAVVHATAASRARALGYHDVARLLDESAAEGAAAGRQLVPLVVPMAIAKSVSAPFHG